MNDHTAPHTAAVFPVADVGVLKRKMLNWLSRFNIFLFLDNQQYSFQPHRFECLAGVGVRRHMHNLEELDTSENRHCWRFGHLAYALKEELHGLPDGQPDRVGFSHQSFFVPEVVLALSANELTVYADDPQAVWTQLQEAGDQVAGTTAAVALKPRLSRDAYLQAVRQLQAHIKRGDCYEINFCQEFFSEGAVLDPTLTFLRLGQASPAPFAALYRQEQQYLIAASPERFLARRGDKLVAQPMKGTARRDLADALNDQQLKTALYHSTKERAENVMVVDLVRNDLSQVCTDGSVQVDELYGIYSFPQVHQMVSTISGVMRPEVSIAELMRANFPMGSMTGAPKLRVMQLIDQYETTPRGIFSGSVGYISPEGDFDFNVVIRSIMYNAATGYVSCQVGSGITFYCDAEKEWDECLLKLAAIRRVLEGDAAGVMADV